VPDAWPVSLVLTVANAHPAAFVLLQVIGREREVARVIQILGRRTKNNPILLGEPGGQGDCQHSQLRTVQQCSSAAFIEHTTE
jgi:hypothetical protein